jgi:hypothetical protein
LIGEAAKICRPVGNTTIHPPGRPATTSPRKRPWIDQALEKLSSLGVVTSRYVSLPGPGRRTILWSAIDHQDQELMQEETAETRRIVGGAELVR